MVKQFSCWISLSPPKQTLHNKLDKPIYIWTRPPKIRIGKLKGFVYALEAHRCPNWMPKMLHLILEYFVIYQFRLRRLCNSRMTRYIYHLFYGSICGYKPKEISKFVHKLGRYCKR